MNPRTQTHRSRPGAALVLAAAAGLALGTAVPTARAAGLGPVPPAASPPALDPATIAALPVDPLVRSLVSPPALAAPAPRAHPQEELAAAIARFSRDLGVPRDPAPELAGARLTDGFAGLLAGTVEALDACDRLSTALTAGEPFRHGIDA